VVNLHIRELQDVLKKFLRYNSFAEEDDAENSDDDMIEGAKYLVVDLLAEENAKSIIVEALIQLLMAATLLGIDLEDEVKKTMREYLLMTHCS